MATVTAPIIKATEENIWRKAVAPKYGLPLELPAIVHEADNRIIADEIVPAVPMYHMVSFMRVGERITYTPNSLSGSLIELADITPK